MEEHTGQGLSLGGQRWGRGSWGFLIPRHYRAAEAQVFEPCFKHEKCSLKSTPEFIDPCSLWPSLNAQGLHDSPHTQLCERSCQLFRKVSTVPSSLNILQTVVA